MGSNPRTMQSSIHKCETSGEELLSAQCTHCEGLVSVSSGPWRVTKMTTPFLYRWIGKNWERGTGGRIVE